MEVKEKKELLDSIKHLKKVIIKREKKETIKSIKIGIGNYLFVC